MLRQISAPDVSMFSAERVIITGGDFAVHHQNETDRDDQAIQKLYTKAIPGALHNSGERFDPPRCHRNTRTAIINEVLDWLDILDDEGFVMWINGAAGAGKSAICQFIAEFLFKDSRLSGSFFFSRASPGRNNASGLVATLAHQLLFAIPEAQPLITQAISNTFIFDLSWQAQLEALIVKPLAKLASSNPQLQNSLPQLFIIDGLDECHDADAQSYIVQIFVTAVQQLRRSIPHKLIIASRPESHLVSAFAAQDIARHVKRLCLEDDWKVRNGIRLFLTDSFAELRRTHPLGKFLPCHWPCYSEIEDLVDRSSGQFIYAATVFRYVASEYHHPVERLKDIFGLNQATNCQPFAELDALYRHIFSCAGEPEILLCILFIIRLELPRSFNSYSTKTTPLHQPTKVAQHLLSLSAGMLALYLKALLSIIEIVDESESDPDHFSVSFLHSSFLNFLDDESRSGPFYLYSGTILAKLFKCCLNFHLGSTPVGRSDQRRVCFLAPIWLERHTGDVELRVAVFTAMSQSDLKSLLNSTSQFYASQAAPKEFVRDYLPWLIEEYNKLSSFGQENLLCGAIQQLAEWTVTQLKNFSYNGFDNRNGVDLTIFAMIYPSLQDCWDTYEGSMDTQLHKFLRFLGCRKPRITMSLNMRLCWDSLKPMSDSILRDRSLFGRYALTERRCVDAAINCIQCLFLETYNPRDPLLASNKDFFTHILRATELLIRNSPPHHNLRDILYSTCSPNYWETLLSSDSHHGDDDERYQQLVREIRHNISERSRRGTLSGPGSPDRGDFGWFDDVLLNRLSTQIAAYLKKCHGLPQEVDGLQTQSQEKYQERDMHLQDWDKNAVGVMVGFKYHAMDEGIID